MLTEYIDGTELFRWVIFMGVWNDIESETKNVFFTLVFCKCLFLFSKKVKKNMRYETAPELAPLRYYGNYQYFSQVPYISVIVYECWVSSLQIVELINYNIELFHFWFWLKKQFPTYLTWTNKFSFSIDYDLISRTHEKFRLVFILDSCLRILTFEACCSTSIERQCYNLLYLVLIYVPFRVCHGYISMWQAMYLTQMVWWSDKGTEVIFCRETFVHQGKRNDSKWIEGVTISFTYRFDWLPFAYSKNYNWWLTPSPYHLPSRPQNSCKTYLNSPLKSSSQLVKLLWQFLR